MKSQCLEATDPNYVDILKLRGAQKAHVRLIDVYYTYYPHNLKRSGLSKPHFSKQKKKQKKITIREYLVDVY
jgi:hypothetical protein